VVDEPLSFVRRTAHKIEALTMNVIVASTEEAL
jgi:hypothetical protein